MLHNRFVHFRTQSSYSMLESTIKVKDLITLTKKYNMNAVCLSDRGNLFASLEFSLEASKFGIQPICGVILNLLFDRTISKKYFGEILLIAKNRIGYKNLLRLVSYSFIKNDRKVCNHITLEDLEEYSSGLIILSSYTQGIVGKLLLEEDYSKAEKETQRLVSIFGDRFYFEIMRHNLADEKKIEAVYIQMANKFNIPLIATNQVLFSDIKMHDAHDTLLCISEGLTKEANNRKRVSNQCYFKSAEEMTKLFSDLPEAIENSINLVKRIYVMVEKRNLTLPNFINDTKVEENLIREEAKSGLNKRLSTKFSLENTEQKYQSAVNNEYFKRLEYELEIICKMNFQGYFLIVSDFIKWSKKNGIAVGPGRGSGAGSVVAWSLEITNIDPIKFDLIFERFLNPERISMPDFDIDFCQERREEVITYVKNKYGKERVGQIITFGKLQAKAVIKDVSRVLGLSYQEADYLTELVPFNAINPVTLKQAITEVRELKEAAAGQGLYKSSGDNELIKQVLDTSLMLEGLHRHCSTHAAGIVIANENMIENIPLYKDNNSDMLIVQYSMKYCELAGLNKFDLLGLQTLTVITKCIELLKQQNIIIDLEKIPLDDKKTFFMLSQGMGNGVFQFESIGMKNNLKKLQPDNINDIIALAALYRPGPMDNISSFIACKHGKQKVDYLHPLLVPILKSTYGIIIYQEQVLEIAKKLSGYTLGSADLLRRAMGKKEKIEMDLQEEVFVRGAVKNNIPTDQAKSIFAKVAKFAGYGFNKAHASAYGIISYQTAFLKANFPAEFLVAAMNLDIDNRDKINSFLQEIKTFNIQIVAPSINESNGQFTVRINKKNKEKEIIFPFGAIKSVTVKWGEQIQEIRKKTGNFKSIIDFIERTPDKLLNRKILENIIKAGCFDLLHSNRNTLNTSIKKLMSYSFSYHNERKSNQFSLIEVNQISKNVLDVNTDKLNEEELAYQEFEVMGLFLKNHPLAKHFPLLEQHGIKSSTYIKNNLVEGAYILKVAGIIIKKGFRMSKRGRFMTLVISDPQGIIEITIYNEQVMRSYASLINIKGSVVVACDVLIDTGGAKLTAKNLSSVNSFLQHIVSNKIELFPQSRNGILKLVNFLLEKKKNEKGKLANLISIFFALKNGFTAKISLDDNFYLSKEDLIQLNSFEKE